MTRTAMQCLGSAIRIESLAQELYAGLAATFEHQPYLRELFTQLAAEEGQHAMRIRLLERHQGRAPWPQETIERISADLDAVQEEMAAMKASFRMLSAAADARPVLRRLADMEERFGSIHAEELARSSEPAIQKLFGALSTQDARHQELIQKALDRNAA
jgi:rubrerythrin